MKIPFARIISIVSIPLIVLSLFFGVFQMQKARETVSLPDYGAAPKFILTDQSNKPFASEALAGKPWLASFMFTRCPDTCPLMSLKLGKLAKQIQNINYVSFTSDPDFDKPEILDEFVKRGVGPKDWIFLTGEKEELKKIAAAFMLSAPDNPGLHSSRFILIDRNGRIRGFYDSQSKEQMDALLIDVRGLLSLN